MDIILNILVFLASFIFIYLGYTLIQWTMGTFVLLLASTYFGITTPFVSTIFFILWGGVSLLNIEMIRLKISGFMFHKAKNIIPKLSKTEEIALNAGDTWVEETVFRGEPNFHELDKILPHTLTSEEQSFLDNEVEELCSMFSDWDLMQEKDLPQDVWDYLKKKGFFGLVINKKYGGKGFSAKAHSDVVLKIATYSPSAAVTVMVPNSLGPGELLHHYGTEEQKNNYLPKLSIGEEFPCFALTEPNAGSDATSISSSAIVCQKEIDGVLQTGLLLSFNKRYITLAPVATLVGLAVNLRDPNKLLDEGSEGITCLLIPRTTEGLDIGNRHYPSGLTFMNGIVRGKDIFVGLDTIIGGKKMAGSGWKMLVECLSIGRSISLPAMGTATSSLSLLSSGAYSHIRKQFGLEIGKFEGVEEFLAQIAGTNYITNATRQLTLAAVDAGKKPSVASAIAKLHNTEHGRTSLMQAMDIHAGKAIVIGPRNYLFSCYAGSPVAITVEGANIMTRNLLVFGQGAMACHPFIRKEFYALSNDDEKKGLKDFDGLMWNHGGYLLRNKTRSLFSGLTNGLFIQAPNSPLKKYYKRVKRLSYDFAFVADLSLMYLGSDLKRKERLSARLGDALSQLYMSLAVLKMFKDNGEQEDELIYATWALEQTTFKCQESLIEYLGNFPNKFLAKTIKFSIFPFGRVYKKPNDVLDAKISRTTMTNNSYRDFIKRKIYMSKDEKDLGYSLVETAFQKILACDEIYKKLMKAVRNKQLPKAPLNKILKTAIEKNLITKDEYNQVLEAEDFRNRVTEVDEFKKDQLTGNKIEVFNK